MLHHKTLEAAVNKFRPLVGEGKTEAEIKEAIAADEKAFDEASIAEIFAAITASGDDAAEKAASEAKAAADAKAASDKAIADAKAATDKAAAEKAASEKAFKNAKHIVSSDFRDIDNFDKVYRKGDDVSHFESTRLAFLLENGHVVRK